MDVRVLVTMFDETGDRSRSHGLRPSVLAAQATRMHLPMVSGAASWPDYEPVFVGLLTQVRSFGCTHVIFGDIFEDAHRAWTERVCAAAGLTALQPLWGESTAALAREFLDRGGRANITTLRQSALDESWLGKALTPDALAAFEQVGIDPAGERGEYHTVVTDCPLFSAPLLLTAGTRVERGGCWSLDFALASVDPSSEDANRALG
jgi:uncharacterized protein (TIGR00290 family)